jgi:small subunit ribosomal protein S4
MIKKQKPNQRSSSAKDLFQSVAVTPVANTKKSSEYGKQLREKQKVKNMYGVREKQFRRFFSLAKKSKDATGEQLISLLERRLDNVLYRLKFFKTRLAARKFIVHGHVELDGRRVFSPSILVALDSVVSFVDKTKKNEAFMKAEVDQAMARVGRVPDWLEMIKDQYVGKVLRLPVKADIDVKINENYIVELFSK